MSRQQAPLSPLFDEDKKLGSPEHYEDAEFAERQPGKETTEAAKVLATSEKVTWTIAEERKLLRRIDLWVCVPMMITYFIQQLDKSSVSYAAVFDLREATNLEKTEYSWLSSIVYVAQLVLQPLSSYALVVFPVKYWVMFNMISWGIVTACTAAATNFSGLITARAFLGAFEATILPSFVMITQMWWSRREQSYRTIAWQVANSCAAIFGPLLSYGVGHINTGIYAYQSIFIFMGAITLAVSPLIWYLLPNSPETAKFLSKGNDRYIAIERLRANNTGTKSNKWKWSQCRECFMDPKTYGWAVMYVCCATPSGGFGAFGGLITKGFGFNSFHSILMQMPTGAIQIVFLILSIWLTNKIKLRFPILAVLCLFPIGGAIGLLMVSRDKPTALLGCYYVALILGCLQPLLYSWANLNAAGHTKKVCTTAVMFVFQCVGNIIGPQVYLEREAPKYFTGLYVDIACWCLLCLSIIAMGAYLKYLNKKQEKRRIAAGRPAHVEDTSIMSMEEAELYKLKLKNALAAEGKEDVINEAAFDDLTDWENMDFIYVL